MAEGEWFYCLKHKTVEPYDACKSESRLGLGSKSGADASGVCIGSCGLRPFVPLGTMERVRP